MGQDGKLVPMEPSFKCGGAGFSLFFGNPIYTAARTLAARMDQQAAFLINRVRSGALKIQRVQEIESTLSQTLQALDDVIATLPPKEQAEVKQYKAQTSVLLSQIRGGSR